MTVGGARQDVGVLLADIVSTSAAVAATRSRKEKVALLAERLTAASSDEP